MKRHHWMLLGMAALMPFLPGCMCGRVVPPGKVVIVLEPSGDTEIYTEGVYYSYGRDKLYFVDQKLKAFQEGDMKILCADDINMDVDIKAVLSFDVSDEKMEFIKKKVPAVKVEEGDIHGMELQLEQFYKMAVQSIVRGTARNIISKLKTDDIRPQREQLEKEIQASVKKRVEELGYPLNISAVLISNIDYPKSVTDQREAIKKAQLEDEKKAAEAEAMLAQAKREVAIEQEKAKVRMVKAQAQADENEILTKSLTPQFLMWRQLEVMEESAAKLAAGASNTIFMMPYATMDKSMLNTAIMKNAIDKKK